MQHLGTAFETTGPDSLIRYRFGLYATPAGTGRIVEAGPGSRQGLWHSFSVQDGLASAGIYAILEDRQGQLWFGTWDGGISRYDGETFATLTTEDGLPNNDVTSILEDHQGQLWFATSGSGVSRYDGQNFKTFSTKDGLPNNDVRSILEDR